MRYMITVDYDESPMMNYLITMDDDDDEGYDDHEMVQRVNLMQLYSL